MNIDEETLTALRRQNIELQARVAELEPVAAKYHALCSITPDIMLVIDRDGGYGEISETLGFPPELIAERRGTNLRDTFPADVAEEMLACIRRTLSTGEPSRIEYRVPAALGDQRHAGVIARLTDTTVFWFAQDMTAARALEQAERTLRTFKALVDSTPDGVALITPEGAIEYTNAAFRELVASDAPTGEGASLPDHIDARGLACAIEEALSLGAWQGPMTVRRADATDLPCQVSLVRLHGEHDGASATRLAAIARDLTPLIEAEQHRIALQEQIIAAQRTALRELSTPLLPLAKGVLAMPLIGALDSERALEVMETLLEGITRQRAHTAILDVTGIRTLDDHAADALVQVARAARLLGARVILTGISPDIAQALLHLDGGLLQGIMTRGTLQTGIAEALAVRTRAT